MLIRILLLVPFLTPTYPSLALILLLGQNGNLSSPSLIDTPIPRFTIFHQHLYSLLLSFPKRRIGTGTKTSICAFTSRRRLLVRIPRTSPVPDPASRSEDFVPKDARGRGRNRDVKIWNGRRLNIQCEEKLEYPAMFIPKTSSRKMLGAETRTSGST